MSLMLGPSKSRAVVSRIVSSPVLLGSRKGRSTVTASSAITTRNEGKPIQSILIANRGEIALRVGRTASQYGIQTTTVYTDPDARSQHALSSPFSINLGDPSAYLDGDRIIEATKQHGVTSIHPGYGFVCFPRPVSLKVVSESCS